MSLKILLIPMLVILCCSPAAKESSALGTETASALRILSATETDWFGGVRGVRGKIFKICLETKLKQKPTFSDLEINGQKIPVSVSVKNKIYTITARTSISNPVPDFGITEENGNVTIGSGILHYSISGSKTLKKLPVPKFIHVENVMKNTEEPVQ